MVTCAQNTCTLGLYLIANLKDVTIASCNLLENRKSKLVPSGPTVSILVKIFDLLTTWGHEKNLNRFSFIFRSRDDLMCENGCIVPPISTTQAAASMIYWNRRDAFRHKYWRDISLFSSLPFSLQDLRGVSSVLEFFVINTRPSPSSFFKEDKKEIKFVKDISDPCVSSEFSEKSECTTNISRKVSSKIVRVTHFSMISYKYSRNRLPKWSSEKLSNFWTILEDVRYRQSLNKLTLSRLATNIKSFGCKIW